MKALNKFNVPVWLRKWAFIAGIVLLALLLFHPLFAPNRCLFSTDDNMGIMPSGKENFPSLFLGIWGDQGLYGMPGGRGPISWTPVIMGLLPISFGFNWIHAIDLVLASVFLFFFLRADNVSLPAIALGILTAFWLGSNLTLTYAGHIAKISMLMLSAAVLVCLRHIQRNDRDWFWCIIAGGLMGLMFIEQQDVALFFNIFLGPYALFQIIRAHFLSPDDRQAVAGEKSQNDGKRGIIRAVLLLVLMLTVSLLVSSSTLISSYTSNIKSVSQSNASDGQAKQAKWEFATQWSWPPEESVDFVAPGYMGWRSGEPDGPYWGRMGRSAGWEKTGQGFMNFKLENQYLGAIPVIFALFAVLIAVMRSDYRMFSLLPESVQVDRAGNAPVDLKRAKAEIIFWFFVAALTLLLSFGKYFPLYELFYQLPVVSSIRNPNKFLQVFQLAVGILAAYGAHLSFHWHTANSPVNNNRS